MCQPSPVLIEKPSGSLARQHTASSVAAGGWECISQSSSPWCVFSLFPSFLFIKV